MNLTTSPTSSQTCLPRWATKRNPDRPNRADSVGALSARLGQPLMPWQQQVIEVATEIDPDTGWPAYREIVVTVPRQSGKTTLVLAWEVDRALMWGKPQRIAYTAQTGFDARRKLLDDQAPILMGSSLAAAVDRVQRAQGNEALVFRNGSRIDVLASTESAGHGKSLDAACIDEAFADTDDRRETAILPTMATRRDAQVMVVSTMGTDASTLLNRKVAAGRAAVEAGQSDGIAYFEWSADPDMAIDDPATWWSCMPALGHTITEDVVRHALQTMSEGEFRRSWLNQQTRSSERVIPLDAWERVVSDSVAPDGGLQFAFDVSADRSHASIAVSDENNQIEVIDSRPGVAWLVERIIDLSKKWDATVLLDGLSPAGGFADQLEAAGVRAVRLSTREVAFACGAFYDSVMSSNISIRSHPDLEVAIAAAKRRQVGDSWIWSRSGDVDVSSLVAATLAGFRRSATQPTELWVAYD